MPCALSVYGRIVSDRGWKIAGAQRRKEISNWQAIALRCERASGSAMAHWFERANETHGQEWSIWLKRGRKRIMLTPDYFYGKNQINYRNVSELED